MERGRLYEGTGVDDRAWRARTPLWRSAWGNPVLLLTLTTLIWAGHALVGRLAVGEIGPMTLVTLRWAVALIPIVLAARKTLKADWARLSEHWPKVAAMGALGYTGFNALFYAAAHYTSAINMSLIQGSIPALVLIGSSLAYRLHASALAWAGALTTIAGVATIAAAGDWGRLAHANVNIGDAMMLLACAFYAFYTLALRGRPNASPFGFLAAMAFAALIASLPLFVAEVLTRGFTVPTWRGALVLLYAALGPAFVAQVFFMRGVELIGPSRAGVFINLVPVFGALMAVALLGEPFAAYHVVALALVVAGIVMAQRR